MYKNPLPDPTSVRDHIVADISDALLLQSQVAMGKPPLPPKKKRRKRTNIKKAVASQACMNPLPDIDGEDFTASLQTRLEELRATLVVPEVGQASGGWTRRQELVSERAKVARPVLLDARLSGQKVLSQSCQKCLHSVAVIRCLDCVPQDMEYLCGLCDKAVHRREVFHGRMATFNGFMEVIPPTVAVVLDSSGKPQLCEQVCQLPLPIPRIICGCPEEAVVTPGRPVAVVTMNGRFDFHLPRKVCSACSAQWTPGVKDLVAYQYWPSTSCQTLYALNVFQAFSELKVSAPSFSRNAFIKLLQHQSAQGGRSGNISGDTFQRSYFEFCLCQHTEDKMTEEDSFNCPACEPDMLAVCCDGNRKHYRFKKNQGTEEPSMFEDLFIAKDKEVSTFVDKIRGSSRSRANDSRTCGLARFRASRETSKKSSSKIDEEGLQVAVCRHGILLRGLNHYRGEIFAYPLYLQQEVSERANVTFFCMDVACRFWPYLSKVVLQHPELSPLKDMKPFLSVMHAKVHRPKCEVIWGGRNLEGAGNTVGEEVEQVNSFLSRAAVVTKYMTKSGRENMLTQQAMGWNTRKKKHLHKALAFRYTKISERAKTEADNHRDFCLKNGITEEKVHQCVHDVLQWAAEEVGSMEQANEELMEDIETALVDLLRKKQDLYRDHDSSKIREKKRRQIRTLKEKLKQKVEDYNETADEKVDVELACNLNEHYILPWERGRDVNARLKRSVFDQTMLIRRLEEEQTILVKEMTQHITSLRKEKKSLEKLADGTISNSEDLSEDATAGLQSVCRRRLSAVSSNLQEAIRLYTALVDNLSLDELSEDGEDDYDSSSDSEFSFSESEDELQNIQ